MYDNRSGVIITWKSTRNAQSAAGLTTRAACLPEIGHTAPSKLCPSSDAYEAKSIASLQQTVLTQPQRDFLGHTYVINRDIDHSREILLVSIFHSVILPNLPSAMSPVIHLVRHAQGYHNLSKENEQIPDPDLTPLGEEQCQKLCESFPYHDQITHLVASPMRRTLYTCLLSFAPVVARGKVVTALPDAQEVSRNPCDVGSEPEKLEAEFGGKVEFSLVKKGWNDKSRESKYSPLPAKLEARARDTRIWLRELAKSAGDDAHIVLVTHGGILHFLTQDWEGIEQGRGTGWENTEYRSYEFEDATYQDPDAALKETHPSWRRRRGSAIPLSETEHRQIQQAIAEQIENEIREKNW
ncbi:histidine phosphatase superfamily [Xylariales sp. PMI_506]|nr:histidine phosphatase superfamily [Xylariales sp. PMI_506]